MQAADQLHNRTSRPQLNDPAFLSDERSLPKCIQLVRILAVQLVRFFMIEFGSPNQSTLDFIAIGIKVNSAGAFLVFSQPDHVDIENECRLIFRLEPVNVVVVVGNAGVIAGSEFFIDRRLNKEMI